MAEHYDVLVVGGGHAGIEAAWASSRMGASTALITMGVEAIGRMSCNPSIGGLGKGQIVREIDAMGGLMGVVSDRAGIQFRLLNRRKGPAVQAPRAQADRDIYSKTVLELLSAARSLDIIEGTVDAISTVSTKGDHQRPRATGVSLADGRQIRADRVIITTGTFLNGLMHRGAEQFAGGRLGEPPAIGLSSSLAALGFELGRLKTGTPPRVHRDSVDYDACEIQPADELPSTFSFMTDVITQRQLDCWITYTNETAHDLIRQNLDRAPLFSGQIQSTGPRYCPSIEDKAVRFADKPRHLVFLEPEGYDDERIYCNGLATSLPRDVQDGMLYQIPGLRGSKIVQYGYAIEYDWVPTHQIKVSLETKLVDGLLLAGQINGTSGYEEAAGQGMIAGINAVRSIRGEDPFVLGRDEAYIGVMIDDLITKPPIEPYRMFTSRAEYRLQLRSDNADQRLTPAGRLIGLVDDARWHRYVGKRDALQRIASSAAKVRVNGSTLDIWARRHDADLVTFADTVAGLQDEIVSSAVLEQYLTDAKYAGYLNRQNDQIERFKKLESMVIPEKIEYLSIPELRMEAREALARVCPRTLGQASRISGINPSDITVLWIYASGRKSLRATG